MEMKYTVLVTTTYRTYKSLERVEKDDRARGAGTSKAGFGGRMLRTA